MPLTTMKDIVYKAYAEKYGVGAYSVLNTDALQAIVRAAEEKRSPLILQIAQIRELFAPLSILGPALVAAADNATVPVAVHLDHGETFEYIQHAIDIGFSSVMIDASSHPLEQNIECTKKIVTYARERGITVEAELGCIGKEGSGDGNQFFTVPEEAVTFCQQADPDVLAVSVGNVHGPYKGEPSIQFELLDAIHKGIDRPIVLHGGSGIDRLGFRKCIDLGVSKINIATANYADATQCVQDMPRFKVFQETSFIEIQKNVIHAIHRKTMEHMDMFMSTGKA